MPTDYTIYKDRRFIRSTGFGVVTLADCLEHQKRLTSDPEFDPTYSQLIDFTEVTLLDLTAADVRILAQADMFSPQSRRAICSTTEFGFGLARMFEVFRELAGEPGIRVFRDKDQALAWLFAEPASL